MSRTVVVEAPSRLHFGMFAFGAGHRRQFGGVGLMIEEPRLRVVIRPAGKFTCAGLHAERALRIARQVAGCWLAGRLPDCEVLVEEAPREHAGLGLGTQLSLAVGVALAQFAGFPNPPSPVEIAIRLGRARRSSVGAYGFMHGGLILDAGHAAGESIGTLVKRVELPDHWRVLLITPCLPNGLSGGQEAEAFAELPPVPPEVTGQLAREVLLEMLPAAVTRDFVAFSQSVYRFGRAAGNCFAGVQGGPYATSSAAVVDRLRKCGVVGVGQSSWGPTVFALVENDAAAELKRQWSRELDTMACEIKISRPDNRGAVVATQSAEGGLPCQS
jgi:beta-RFAP synthase